MNPDCLFKTIIDDFSIFILNIITVVKRRRKKIKENFK
jgi:hypothetical protein